MRKAARKKCREGVKILVFLCIGGSLLGGCAPSRTGVEPKNDPLAESFEVAGDTPEQLAQRYLAAVEAADADAIRAAYEMNRPFMERHVDLQARSLATFRRAWLKLAEQMGEEQANRFIEEAGFRGILAPGGDDPVVAMRDLLESLDNEELATQMIATEEGWRFDQTLPPIGEANDWADVLLRRAAFTLGDHTAMLLYFTWLENQLDAGVTDPALLTPEQMAEDVPENWAQVTADTEFVLEGIAEEARRRELTELAGLVEQSLAEVRQSAAARQPFYSEPITQPATQPAE